MHVLPEGQDAVRPHAGRGQGVEHRLRVPVRVSDDRCREPRRGDPLVHQRLGPVAWLVHDDEPGAESGHPGVDRALALVPGTDDRDDRTRGAHDDSHRGSSTRAVAAAAVPGRRPPPTSSDLIVGAASRASSSTLPSRRSTLLSTAVVTVAFRGALVEQAALSEPLPWPEPDDLGVVAVDDHLAVDHDVERVRRSALHDDVDTRRQGTQLGGGGELLEHDLRDALRERHLVDDGDARRQRLRPTAADGIQAPQPGQARQGRRSRRRRRAPGGSSTVTCG